MGYRNGYLPDSALKPIPGGRLVAEAADAWNAMCAEARSRGMAVPMPDGPDSSYRDYARQVFWRDYWCGRGQCVNAAVPGTSRHGMGIAVDCAEDAVHHAATIDAIGEKYGWSKKWSDAPWEPWHNTYKQGLWHRVVVLPFLPLHIGVAGKQHASTGYYVWLLTHRLSVCNYLNGGRRKYDYTVEAAVKHFQSHHHLQVDGIVGTFTWNTVRQSAAWCRAHNRKEV